MNHTFIFAFHTDPGNPLLSFTFTSHKPEQTSSKINYSRVEKCWETCWKLTNAFYRPHSLPFHRYSSAWLTRVSLPTQLSPVSLCSSSSTNCCCCPFTHPFLPAPQLCKFPENLQLPQSFCQFCKCLCPLQVQGEARRLCSELQTVQHVSHITWFSHNLPCHYK